MDAFLYGVVVAVVAGFVCWVAHDVDRAHGRRYRWRQWEQWRDLHNGWDDKRGRYGPQ